MLLVKQPVRNPNFVIQLSKQRGRKLLRTFSYCFRAAIKASGRRPHEIRRHQKAPWWPVSEARVMHCRPQAVCFVPNVGQRRTKGQFIDYVYVFTRNRWGRICADVSLHLTDNVFGPSSRILRALTHRYCRSPVWKLVFTLDLSSLTTVTIHCYLVDYLLLVSNLSIRVFIGFVNV